jgi:feruloyl-CoA hydratase/lyase
VNVGILPGSFVSKALAVVLNLRDAVWYAIAGDTFDGREVARIRLINKACRATRYDRRCSRSRKS